jgi:hypothetical protein
MITSSSKWPHHHHQSSTNHFDGEASVQNGPRLHACLLVASLLKFRFLSLCIFNNRSSRFEILASRSLGLAKSSFLSFFLSFNQFSKQKFSLSLSNPMLKFTPEY